MEMLLKKAEACLDGTVAKAPVAAINALIDIKNVRCQSQRATSLLNIRIRWLGTTRALLKDSSFKPQKDCSPWIGPWTKVSPTLQSHEWRLSSGKPLRCYTQIQ